SFAIYWILRADLPDQGPALAREVNALFERFPHAFDNADEFRKLKAEMYRVLLPLVSGHRMVDLTDEILRLPRP
ncbi:MAG TPA: hypothetical protein VID74_05035, partial [Gemmatimonadales bacterium]